MNTESKWLIDASQINIGGAVAILKMVLDELEAQKIEYIVIQDKRLEIGIVKEGHGYIPQFTILGRKSTYRKLLASYQIERIVSLISIPPPIRVDVPVHTYFHNVNLLKDANLSNSGIKYKLLQRLKNRYLRSNLKNTDYYTFQSKLIQELFRKDFDFPEDKCHLYPFYDESEILNVKNKGITKVDSSFIYVSSDYPHKNHLRLLESWELLLHQGYTPLLTLTIPEKNKEICTLIDELNAKGCKIQNLGVIDYAACLDHTARSQYCIFPSLSESLGLGLVEGQMLGCQVLVSDMEYAYQAVEPSGVFDPYKVQSIVEIVKRALQTELPKSELKMKNALSEWIESMNDNVTSRTFT